MRIELNWTLYVTHKLVEDDAVDQYFLRIWTF